MRVLPKGEFDGQLFIDSYGIEWSYDKLSNWWKRNGKPGIIPVADSATIGLLSKNLKFLLDRVPDKGGGFAIITRPHLQLRSKTNPDGVLFGDVKLISDSLEIKCVHGDGREIADDCHKVCYSESDILPPGFDINLSDKLLRTMCVVVPGGPGLPGAKGLKGPDGKDGTGDGPQGQVGDAGEDATETHVLSGVKVVDLDDVTDVAVTKLELDSEGGKLYAIQGKVKVPDNDEASADKLIASQINRGINFGDNCWDYEITMLPCTPGDDFDVLDPAIAYYPSNFSPSKIGKEPKSYQPVKRVLSDLIDDIIGFYQKILDYAAGKYNKEVEEFIKQKDKEARLILDQLGDRLAECENITYLEYCIGLGDKCVEDSGNVIIPGATPIIDIPSNSPDCAVIAQALGSDGACQSLSSLTVRADYAPVFSFEAPKSFTITIPSLIGGPVAQPGYELYCPRGCWVSRGEGNRSIIQWIQKGQAVPDGWTPIKPPGSGFATPLPQVESRPTTREPSESVSANDPNAGAISDLTTRLNNGIVLYRKQQFLFSALSNEFSAGLYAFVYVGGGFRQDRLGEKEGYRETTADLFHNAYGDWFVGNEGNGTTLGPSYVHNPLFDRRVPINSILSSLEIGLEIGFAPNTYKNNIPDDFFSSHAYNPSAEAKNALIPLPRVDYEGLPQSVKTEEAKIQWKKFPTVSANHSDVSTMQSAYNDSLVQNRMVTFETTQSGFFFARVKLAFTGINNTGVLIMPPGSSDGIYDHAATIALVSRPHPKYNPMINVKPIGMGEVEIKVVKVDPPTTTPPIVEGP